MGTSDEILDAKGGEEDRLIRQGFSVEVARKAGDVEKVKKKVKKKVSAPPPPLHDLNFK